MNLIKNLLTGLILIFFISRPSTTYAQTQMEMNLQAGADYKKIDKEMNRIYQKVLNEYASQLVFIKKFKTAQRLWLQLRDAELEAKFPGPDYYGSVEPMCRMIYLEDLTKERIKFLKVWLDGIPEGDVCNGSVKVSR